jgi:dGTP triphosphohydrolase
MLRKVFIKFVQNPAQLPDYILKRAKAAAGIQPNEKINNLVEQNDSVIRIIADHIAGMTDRFAVMEFEKLTKLDDKRNSPFVIS